MSDCSAWLSKVMEPENQIALASLLLAAIGILVAISTFVSYLAIKNKAAKLAKEEANKVAGELAEKAANAYLQDKIPDIISAYLELAKEYVASGEAQKAAEMQDNEEDKDGII